MFVVVLRWISACVVDRRVHIVRYQDPHLRRENASGALCLGLHATAHQRAKRQRERYQFGGGGHSKMFLPAFVCWVLT